jgi:hypothetical protein
MLRIFSDHAAVIDSKSIVGHKREVLVVWFVLEEEREASVEIILRVVAAPAKFPAMTIHSQKLPPVKPRSRIAPLDLYVIDLECLATSIEVSIAQLKIFSSFIPLSKKKIQKTLGTTLVFLFPFMQCTVLKHLDFPGPCKNIPRCSTSAGRYSEISFFK